MSCGCSHVGVEASGNVALDLDARFACVSKVPIFRDLPIQERRSIAARVTTRAVGKGQVIQAQGAMPALQIVHRGQVKQVRLGADGSERLLRILGPGEFMGEHSVLTGSPAPRMATTVTDAMVCTLSRIDVQQWLEQRPQMAVNMLQVVTQRLEETEAQLAALADRTVAQRLGDYLMTASDRPVGDTFELPVSKKDLASLIGTTPETLSRRLRALADRGVLALGPGRRITILDEQGLQEA
ncbi:Crp/Fnr family transcriptional regulator [Kocuria sp. JC486]|uniref:Crp/Fnr family transcriptional regulator n=1 Tax=Kocuria soli TaxID=2485125 RepID=A0A3N3ZZF0_9MICC|nr:MULTISPECIES: Crp/Fnr family transcriptional regulator [Kocuria]NHU85557.1 Crp/Fnr family transcriptional regulator [Kocuria sp. JC486]ROZ64370.1 Crp/Fnr family transcriptional regulator [Kocuria soli]